MNVSIPTEVRGLVRQAAISTAALQRESVDDSSWIVRAVCEKLVREWGMLDLREPVPDSVARLGGRGLTRRPHERVLLVTGGAPIQAGA